MDNLHAMFHGRRARLLPRLQSAVQRHDAKLCAHADCKRCEGARARGEMCALPGCGARKRDGSARKNLLLCGACHAGAYCGPAHQRADWKRHKPLCAAAGAAAGKSE
jgi:hypothetical protein